MGLYVVRFGVPFYDVIAMDMRAFTSLFISVMEIENTAKAEMAWTAYAAASGDHKYMKAWVDQWSKKPKKATEKDTNDFIAKLGKGSK